MDEYYSERTSYEAEKEEEKSYTFANATGREFKIGCVYKVVIEATGLVNATESMRRAIDTDMSLKNVTVETRGLDVRIPSSSRSNHSLHRHTRLRKEKE